MVDCAAVGGAVEAAKLGRGEKTGKIKMGSPVPSERLVLRAGGRFSPKFISGFLAQVSLDFLK